MRRYLENMKTGHFEKLRGKKLFLGLSDSEIYTFLHHSKPYYIELGAGQVETIEKRYSSMIGVVISGEIVIYSVDYNGNRTLIKEISDGETSGSLYSLLDYEYALIEIEGRRDSEIIFIKPESFYRTEESIAVIQQKILVNLIDAQKDLFRNMSKRLYCLAQRSIRDKILKFLGYCCERFGSNDFDISMTREELADYLAVDRASLSRSLGELKKEGIIDFEKSHFKVLDKDAKIL